MEVEAPHDPLKRLLKRLQTLYQQDDQFVILVTQAVSPELSQVSRLDRLKKMFKISFDSFSKEELDKFLKNATAPLQLLMDIQQIQDALYQVTDFVLKHIQDHIPKGSSQNDIYLVLKNLQNIFLALGRNNLQQLRSSIVNSPRHVRRHTLLSILPTIPVSSIQLVLTLIHLSEGELDEFKQWIDNLSHKRMLFLANLANYGPDLPLVKKKLNDYDGASLKRPLHFYPIDDNYLIGDNWGVEDEKVHKKEKLTNSTDRLNDRLNEPDPGFMASFNNFMVSSMESFPSTWVDPGFEFDIGGSTNLNSGILSSSKENWMNVCTAPLFTKEEFDDINNQLGPFSNPGDVYLNQNNNSNISDLANSTNFFSHSIGIQGNMKVKKEKENLPVKNEHRGLSGQTYENLKKESNDNKTNKQKQDSFAKKPLHKLPSEAIKTSAQSSNDLYEFRKSVVTSSHT
jgi:hypothetical protein